MTPVAGPPDHVTPTMRKSEVPVCGSSATTSLVEGPAAAEGATTGTFVVVTSTAGGGGAATAPGA